MMIKKLLLVTVLMPLIVFAQPTNADSTFIKKMSDNIFQEGKAYDWLKYLCKNIGGRLAGSPQYAKAAIWGKTTMMNIGATNVQLQPVLVPHWVRGNNDFCQIVSINGIQKTIPLQMTALGNSMGCAPKIITAEVISVNSFEELDQKKQLVKDKIVLYNVPFKETNIVPGQSYGQMGKYRYSGASMAAKYGAVGMLLHSLSSVNDNQPHTGVMQYNDSFPKIPAIALGPIDAKKLATLCQEKKVKVSLQTHGKMLPDATDYNVIGEIKGSTFPDKIITIGGHLDSWDINEGAHDDGAGIVQTLEVLRTYKAVGFTPKHTIRFVLFANEENGTRGAKVYADSALKRQEKHVFALESDMGGFTPRNFTLDANELLWNKINSWKHFLDNYGAGNIISGGGGADIGPLKNQFGAIVSAYMPDNQRYFDLHHAPTDVFENVNRRELLLGAVNMAAFIYLMDQYGLE